MTLDEVKDKLTTGGKTIKSEARLNNDTGVRIDLADGGIVNVFDSGKISYQGKTPEALKQMVEGGNSAAHVAVSPVSGPRSATPSQSNPKRVFVVYGHDSTSRTQLEAMLRRWDLEPLILDQLPNEGQTIIEKLESASKDIHFGVVLATPDDEGHRVNRGDEKAHRARQNVVLELGMLLAKLGRKKVAILLKQADNMERPSDIQGLVYIPFKDDIAKDAGLLLAKELAAQGFNIDIKKL
jgi:predicted nucleotide-binding protein